MKACYLFICHLNPSAIQRLAKRLEEEGADSELMRYCERILRVHSSDPYKLKSIPQWELAAEVIPYMKTDDGAISSVITDHIGAGDNKPNGVHVSMDKPIDKSKGIVGRFHMGQQLPYDSRMDLLTLSRINFQMHYPSLMKLFWHWLRITLMELILQLKLPLVLSTR
ncbi:putative nucleotide binding protein [Corchorus olitorius]|uniref:Nucleotide binding protein n=1 Tax=Corchorus olitorius TaxID=93759 RepID=A0A1R3JA33_9ROSI|nr:putative nucleotide binding protein [Corchorus olitorius]